MNSPANAWPNSSPMGAPFGGVRIIFRMLYSCTSIPPIYCSFRWAFNQIRCGNNQHLLHPQLIPSLALLVHRCVIIVFSLSVSCCLHSSVLLFRVLRCWRAFVESFSFSHSPPKTQAHSTLPFLSLARSVSLSPFHSTNQLTVIYMHSPTIVSRSLFLRVFYALS